MKKLLYIMLLLSGILMTAAFYGCSRDDDFNWDAKYKKGDIVGAWAVREFEETKVVNGNVQSHIKESYDDDNTVYHFQSDGKFYYMENLHSYRPGDWSFFLDIISVSYFGDSGNRIEKGLVIEKIYVDKATSTKRILAFYTYQQVISDGGMIDDPIDTGGGEPTVPLTALESNDGQTEGKTDGQTAGLAEGRIDASDNLPSTRQDSYLVHVTVRLVLEKIYL